MSDSRTFQVTINMTVAGDGLVHWFVTSQEELETVTWSDDGTTWAAYEAANTALDVARTELSHLLAGGHVTI